jgi:hypothetical protein
MTIKLQKGKNDSVRIFHYFIELIKKSFITLTLRQLAHGLKVILFFYSYPSARLKLASPAKMWQ